MVLDATRNALALAEELNVRSLGLPAIGAGTGRLALATSAKQMATAVRDHFDITATSKLRQVVFVLYGESHKEDFLAGARPILDSQPRPT
jgi:O-acetyl-ADP-ribose deacetylase (regulator of RNase III)